MWRPEPRVAAGILAVTLCLLVRGIVSVAAAPVLPPPDPCIGSIGIGCPVGPQPSPGQFRPAPAPSVAPSPAPSPSPGAAPAPGTAGIPTDFGIGALTKWVYNGGAWLGPQIYPMLTNAAGPTDWFGPLYQHMVNIGFLLLLLFTVLGLGCAILRKDGWLLIKVPCWYGPTSMFITVLAITFTQLLERIVDGFSLYMLQAGFGDQFAALLTHCVALFAAGGAGVAFLGPESFVVFLAGMALLGGLLLTLLELVARQVAIYACLLFIPVTIVCLVWPPVTRIAKLMLEVLVGLIVLKWIIAAVFALGGVMLEANPISMGPQGDPGFVTIVAGAVVLLSGVVGGPLFLAKALPFAEQQAIAHWSAQPKRMASRVGLTNTKAMHTALLQKVGSRETKAKLAQGGRTSLVLPQGSTVFVRSPKQGQPTNGRAGGRRRP
ncbi:MAG: hypothetical protein M3075_11280 [Candidatus Dormibacteraeota bacterium]|nr:hypothetical protein [Candidatus Dormibacteraeota bacterium]